MDKIRVNKTDPKFYKLLPKYVFYNEELSEEVIVDMDEVIIIGAPRYEDTHLELIGVIIDEELLENRREETKEN